MHRVAPGGVQRRDRLRREPETPLTHDRGEAELALDLVGLVRPQCARIAAYARSVNASSSAVGTSQRGSFTTSIAKRLAEVR
jgi:hypothetical protein